MLSDLISAYGSKFLVAALGVSLALLCLFIVLWVLRNRAPSPFVRGGRNRQPRLQVLDAAAIDARRRIVLIRRDNVEHLVMIGGPTDLVIEAGIGDERHYLTARALQAQAAEDEARLAHQATASLPSAEAGSSTPLAHDNRGEAPASVIDSEAQLASRLQASARPPVQTPAPIAAAKAEIAAPRPAPISERPADERPKSEPVVAAVSQRPPVTTASAAPVAASPAAKVDAVAPPVSSPIVAAAPLGVQSELRAGTAAVTASFAPEFHAEPAARPPIAAAQQTAPAIVLDGPSETAPRQVPSIPTPATEQAVRPAVTNEPEPPAVAPSLNQPQQASFAVAPTLEYGQSPRIDPPAAFDIPRPADAAPSISSDISPPLAEEVLDAARARVLSPSVDQGQIRPFEADRFVPDRERGFAGDTLPAAPARDENLAAREMSDFEKVLEDEMALHIAADPGPALVQASPATQIPALLPETRPDRPRPPLGTMVTDPRQPAAPAGANPAQPAEEPNLQNEIARIFGEMSASRNP
jgi:Flagellar biosynthesis protein, FliO